MLPRLKQQLAHMTDIHKAPDVSLASHVANLGVKTVLVLEPRFMGNISSFIIWGTRLIFLRVQSVLFMFGGLLCDRRGV